MNVLVITQALDQNDDNLGAFTEWWEELARRIDHMYVIGLRVGSHDLPKNVEVFSLGKERGISKWRQILRFYQILWQLRGKVEVILGHQCPEYVIGAALFTPRTPKVLWYAIGNVHWRLWLAEKLSSKVLTSTKEGFRLPSKKIAVIGQGIDVQRFTFDPGRPLHAPLRILYLGRISPQKDLETLLEAIEKIPQSRLTIAGRALTLESRHYEKQVRQRARKFGKRVEFIGSIPYIKVPRLLADYDVLVNPSKTGSLDKTMLEAMAAGVLPITCNETVAGLLPAELHPSLIFPAGGAKALVDRINRVLELPSNGLRQTRRQLRQMVEQEHSVSHLIDGMMRELRQIVR